MEVHPPDLAPLDGFTVAVTADRRAGEQAELLRRRGAEVLHAPTISTGYLSGGPSDPAEGPGIDTTADVVEHQPDIVVANTAIGMRAWLEAAQAAGVDDDLLRTLRNARVVARGPKAASACHVLGIPVAHEILDERLDGVLRYLLEHDGGVAGKRVAFQRHGAVSPEFVDPLRAAGAELVDVQVYQYGPPADPAPARRLVDAIIDRRVDAVTFTSRPAVDNLFAIAAEADATEALREAFNTEVAAACVGPVCAEGAIGNGIAEPLFPRRGRLGLLVRTLAEHLASRAVTFEVADLQVVVQGSVVVGAGRVELTRREAALLRALARRPGAVVPATVLLGEVWGDATDTHVVEVTVGRLRRRLGPTGLRVVAVSGRGYRLGAHTAARAV